MAQTRARMLSAFITSVGPLFTPFGLKVAADMMTRPSMMHGGGESFVDTMYGIYKDFTRPPAPHQRGGSAARRLGKLALSDAGKRRLRTLLTSDRVVRGGTSVADLFLQVVNPQGYDLVQKALASTTSGGKLKKHRRQRGGDSWFQRWFCDDGASSSGTPTVITQPLLPVSEAINSLPGAASPQQSMEMVKLDRLLADAAFDNAKYSSHPTDAQLKNMPEVARPAFSSAAYFKF